MIEEALNVGLHHIPIPPVLQVKGQVSDRSPCPTFRPVPITAPQKFLLVNRVQDSGAGCLEPLVLDHQDASWPLLAVALRNVVPANQLRPVSLLLQPPYQCLDIRLQILCLRLPRHAIDPAGRVLVQVAPAVHQELDVQAAVEVAKSVRLVGLRLGCYSPQGGWLTCFRSDGVRRTCPVRAASFRHALPLGPWLSHAPSTMLDKTPPWPPAGVPSHRTPPPACRGFHVAAEVPASFRVRVSPLVPPEPYTSLRRIPRAGASGISQVLRRLSSCMPWPVDSGGPSHPRPSGCSCVAFGEREHPRRPQHAHFEAVPALQGARSPLRPAGFSVDASPILFAVFRHGSAMDARLDTGGWLILTRQGLSPCKRRQAFLGARTPGFSRARKPQRGTSGRCRASAANPC